MTPNGQGFVQGNYPNEEYFERLIEFELTKHSDYDSVDPTLYDKDLCLIPTKVLEFIKSTQEKTYQKLEQQYGNITDTQLLKRISS